MADDISYDHDGLDALLNEARSIIDDSRSVTTDDSGIDQELAAKLREDRKAEEGDAEDAEENTLKSEKANREAEELGNEAARDIDSADTDIHGSDRTTGDVSGGAATETSAASPSTAGQDAAAQAAQQQAAQQAAGQQMAQQQAAQQQAAQSQAMQQAQMNAQQQAAWQQAMQQQQAQAEMNQLNAQAQQQALNQTAATQNISAEDIQTILDELYADEGNQVEGTSDGQTHSLPASDTDDLGGAANVSLEKTHDGALSESEAADIINQACDLNGISDDPAVREQFINVWLHMAEHESGLNPGAANGWDSNAVGATQSDGYPAQASRGMLQCIPETFSTYHVSGTSNSIYDPLASAAASINYTMDRYGVSADGSGLDAFAANRGIDPKSGAVTGGYLGY